MDTITSLISLLPTIDLSPTNIALTLLGILAGVIVSSLLLSALTGLFRGEHNDIVKWG